MTEYVKWVSTDKKTDVIHPDDKIFVYVKDYCSCSKRACLALKNHANLAIFELTKKHFVDFGLQKEMPTTEDPEILASAFSFKTVPQIFVYRNKTPYYFGDSSKLLTHLAASSAKSSKYSLALKM